MGQIQVEHLPRKVGRSNYTLRRLIRLWLTIFLNFSAIPLRISSVLGIAMSALGVVMMLIVIIERMTTDIPLRWGSLMAAILLFSGAQLVILGIMGEYLGRVFLTSNRRPQYIVTDLEISKAKSSAALVDQDERPGAPQKQSLKTGSFSD